MTPTCLPVTQTFRGREITVEADVFQCERCRFIALDDDFLERLVSKVMASATKPPNKNIVRA